MPSAQRRLVLGLCPKIFRPELDFLFVTVVAEFFNEFWIRRGTPEQALPPKGDIYVPKEVFPNDFHAGEAAAWEVEDQPNYADRHLSCRYRAALLADPPLELVSLPWASTDPVLREHLQETGIAFVARRSDRNALLKFSDGLIAKVRLEPKAGGGRLFIVPAADLSNPLETWPPDKLFSILTLESSRGSRCFCSLPVPPAAKATLDLSTLEEALSAAKRAGGWARLRRCRLLNCARTSNGLRKWFRPLTPRRAKSVASASNNSWPRPGPPLTNGASGRPFLPPTLCFVKPLRPPSRKDRKNFVRRFVPRF